MAFTMFLNQQGKMQIEYIATAIHLQDFFFVALIFLSNYRISKYINLIWTLFSVSNTELATWCNDECDEEDICE